jgi:hypothetical protein
MQDAESRASCLQSSDIDLDRHRGDVSGHTVAEGVNQSVSANIVGCRSVAQTAFRIALDINIEYRADHGNRFVLGYDKGGTAISNYGSARCSTDLFKALFRMANLSRAALTSTPKLVPSAAQANS